MLVKARFEGFDGLPAVTVTGPGPGWIAIGVENDSYTPNDAGPVQYAYGADTRWVYKTLTGKVTGNNGTFGDPAYGTAKSLWRKPPPSGTTSHGTTSPASLVPGVPNLLLALVVGGAALAALHKYRK